MKFPWVIIVGVLACLLPPPLWSQLKRVPNTTLRLPPAPPVFGYTTERAFGVLAFPDPLAIASPPGETNRLFIVEQRGRVSVITNLAQPTRTIFMDISSRISGGGPNDEQGLLGLAFHPGYATNGYFFLYYTLSTTTAAGPGRHQRLSRFQTSAANPNQGLTNSELPLITQRDDFSNHNGGDVQFGPDGFLYVTLGDEGNQNDAGNNSQRINKDFFASILRLDVDKRPGSRAPNPHPAIALNSGAANYAVPADNPFVEIAQFNGAALAPTTVRTEFWAVGLRNPWRIAFDPVTGFLYCGDVGGNLREEVNVIVKGGNYGWAYREGTVNGPKLAQAPAGFASLRPIQEYGHGSRTNQGNSVTGGVVYRGQRLSQLTGAYVFADYVSGHLWSLRYDGANSTPFQRLTTDTGIAGFGTDPRNGDVLIADQDQDTIKRLVYSTNLITGTPLPPTLADTGAFTDLSALIPQPGIVPYDLNVPFWSDGARKSRWFSVPDPNAAIGFDRDANWTFPEGMVWVKHFELELTKGAPESARRLETRFLMRDANGVYGLTYRWGDSTANATLVPEAGMDETFIVTDQGVPRAQTWHYPGRNECLACHTPAGGWGLGFTTAQLNRDYHHGGVSMNQIQALSDAGYFQTPVTGRHTLRALAPATNHAVSLEDRVRSYLAANCAQCHQPGGSAFGFFDARITTPLAAAGLIHGPLNKTLIDPDTRVVTPGSLARSMLLTRIATSDSLRMPPLASTVLDFEAIDLVSQWITNGLANHRSFADWQIQFFGSSSSPDAAPDADPDGDGARNYLEYLTRQSPVSDLQVWKIAVQLIGDTVQITFPQIANRGFEVQSAASLSGADPWKALEVPGNRPFFSSTNRVAVVEDTINNAVSRFYRVRVYEP